MKKKSEADILKEVYRDSSKKDMLTFEGIESSTGLSFAANYLDIKNKKDTIREAAERTNKR